MTKTIARSSKFADFQFDEQDGVGRQIVGRVRSACARHLPLPAHSKSRYPPNFSLKTILSDSTAMEPVIFEAPARRSEKVMGISARRRPACHMR